MIAIGACTCLLYTSDAADERSSVDLGGRRIIKKKNRLHRSGYIIRYNKKQYSTLLHLSVHETMAQLEINAKVRKKYSKQWKEEQ